jgi:hypothetical protein
MEWTIQGVTNKRAWNLQLGETRLEKVRLFDDVRHAVAEDSVFIHRFYWSLMSSSRLSSEKFLLLH